MFRLFTKKVNFFCMMIFLKFNDTKLYVTFIRKMYF